MSSSSTDERSLSFGGSRLCRSGPITSTFRMSQLEALCQTLEESGTIFFCSDYFDYYLQAKVLLALHGEFSLQEEAPPDDIFQSIFSRRFLAMGRELHFTSARRTLPGTAPGSGLTE